MPSPSASERATSPTTDDDATWKDEQDGSEDSDSGRQIAQATQATQNAYEIDYIEESVMMNYINTKVASITYDVHVSPAKSGHGMFEGVCSIYLASREVGDRISCFVSGTNVNFCLPPALETPVILFAARTGIALMRAFLQKRATIASARDKDVTSGPTLLFYGYCHLDKDSLYKDEIREWEALGIVKAYHAYSNPGDNGDARVASSPRYVQDALWAHRDEVADLFHRGEKILLCGSASRLGQGCARVSKQIMRERTGKSDEEVEEWFRGVTNDRYISDVY